MRLKTLALFLAVTLCGVITGPSAEAAKPWRVSLPDTVKVQGSIALLRDVSGGPVPARVGDMVVYAGGVPNTVVAVSRQIILRKLVTAGLSSGVAFQGAQICHIVFAGRELSSNAVTHEIQLALQNLVPSNISGAPDSWFDLDVPSLRFTTDGQWEIKLKRHTPLQPGRNLVPVEIVTGERREVFSVSVDFHRYNETARAVRTISKDTPLNEAQFQWEWQDLANLPSGVASGRMDLHGASATRTITAGDLLRDADLKDTPLILAGDPVELMVVRGKVAVTVRAFARQPGCLGQTIPVRNELTGRLVNARVAGPGLVEWRR